MSLYQDVIISGFGGQGVMLIGKLLGYSAIGQGLNVTYMPVYGPEMRGGTANCTIVISDDDIGSPIIHSPVSLIIMNRPSLDKFQPRLQDGGVQVLNSSQIDPDLAEKDRVKTVSVPADELSNEILGSARLANMAALGAYIQATQVMPLETVIKGLEKAVPAHYANMIPKNTQALQAGYDAAEKA
ncbi:MAG: 2-oxoacid:ferredoxin oxidoreductase subunit gamma [Desulfovibrio sp.]|nr:MAG: 2-oxoacid:ferredoxin oxidoreductase subunit gamma [Desulfovibrio sp.]